MKKKLLCSLLALGVLGTSTAAFADTISRNSRGQSFSNDWELSTSGTNYIMNYGYNTSWINEDYTHTMHGKYDHSATVSNSNGAYSDNAGSGSWAKIEVTHSGSFIQYSLTY